MTELPILQKEEQRTPASVWSWLRTLSAKAIRGRQGPPATPPGRIDRRRFENRRTLDEEVRLESIALRSQPTTLILEPATACNLKCPFCPTGGGYSGLAKEQLTPENFQTIADRFDVELLDEVLLYNWGEPFLNRHLPEYIEFFSKHNVHTEISVNLSTKDYDDAFNERIVASGIGRIIVSIDGATQASYEKYRVGGNLARVLKNMTGLADAKARLGLDQPQILYKMLLHRYNEHEVDDARRLAAECGVEFLLDDKFWCPDEHRAEWNATAVEDRPEHEPMMALGESSEGVMSTFCRQLWDTVVVNANGDVLPCCLIYKSEQAVGNLLTESLDSIRNGEAMQTLRRYVTDASHAGPGRSNHCEECDARWCTVKAS